MVNKITRIYNEIKDELPTTAEEREAIDSELDILENGSLFERVVSKQAMADKALELFKEELYGERTLSYSDIRILFSITLDVYDGFRKDFIEYVYSKLVDGTEDTERIKDIITTPKANPDCCKHCDGKCGE